MGLEQYIRAGAALNRKDTVLVTNVSGSGSVDLGSAYVLINVSTTAPCRIRLYDDNGSLLNAGEQSRTFGNNNISASVALVADISMSAPGIYGLDPVVYGVVQNTNNKLTNYRINNTQSGVYPTLTFTTYTLEVPTVSTASRVTLPIITGSLSPNQIISGTLASPIIPTTYLLVSASVSGSDTITRLRLYSTNDSLTNLTELSRSFATESSNNSRLIVDAILSGSETTYFIPKIIGANLQNMGTDLNLIRNSPSSIAGNNELYYVLQNAKTSGGAMSISASVHVFSLED